MSAAADSTSAPTLGPPNLALSTKVKVQETEVLLPEKEPSRMDAIMRELKTYQSLWQETCDQAKQSGTDLDTSLLSQGYNCDEGDVERLFENQPTIRSFVDKLRLSVNDDE